MDNQPDEKPEQAEVVTPGAQEPPVAPEKVETATGGNDESSGNETTAKTPENSDKKHQSLAAIAAVLVVLAGAGAAVYAATQHSSAPKTVTKIEDVADLRIGESAGPIGIDTIFPNAPPAQASANIDAQIYEGLVGYSDQKLVPLLASSWTNPDNSTWVFKIKKNIQFQNGKTMTAQDVADSINYLTKDKAYGYYLQTLTGAKVTGTDEVTVTTDGPDSLLLNRLVYGFVFSKNDDGSYSGTGAYTVDTANSKGDSHMRLVAFDGYHQGRPRTRAVDYNIIKKSDQADQLLGKSLDVVDLLANKQNEQTFTAKGYGSITYGYAGSYGLLLNSARQNGPLAKKAVREAVALAIDRAGYDKASNGEKQSTQYVIPKSVVGYDAQAKFPDLDIAKAKQLQKDAGYPNGAPITFIYIKGVQQDPPIYIDQLKAAGFQVTGVGFDSPKEFVQAGMSGKYDILSGSFTSDLGDGLDIFAGLLSTKGAEFPFYNNPDFDKMISDASGAFKPADHIKKVQEINRFNAANYLFIPVNTVVDTIYYPKDYTYRLDATIGFAGADVWRVGKQVTVTEQQ